MLATYISFFSVYNLRKHAAFETTGYDLGIWDQKVWNIFNGRPFIVTLMTEVENNLGNHVDPIAIFVALLYWLHPGSQTLIIIQVVIVSLGAIPIFLYAKSKLHSDFAGLVFAGVYLLFPALESAVCFDFHGITLATPFLAFALWALYLKKYRLLFLFIGLAMACQEDVPLLTMVMGLYIIVMQRNWRVGGIIMLISGLWFIVANFWIIPTYSLLGEDIHIYRYEYLGNSLDQIIKTIVFRPWFVIQQAFTGEKYNYWLRLTMPTAFVSILDPFTLLMAVPRILINTLSTDPPSYQLDKYHSSAVIVPFVVVAGINGMNTLIRFLTQHLRQVKLSFLRNVLLIMVFFVTLIYQMELGYTPLGQRFYKWPQISEHNQTAQTMVSKIPPDAAVAAQNNLVPHLSQRQWIFILPKISHRSKEADFIVFDMEGSLIPYKYIGEYCQQIEELLSGTEYGLIFSEDGLLLFERNALHRASYVKLPPCD